MKKLLIGLAVAGLFCGSGVVLACDLQDEASIDAPSVAMSKGTPNVVACDGGNCAAKAAVATKTKSTAKTAAKVKAAKHELIASKVDG